MVSALLLGNLMPMALWMGILGTGISLLEREER